MKNNKDIDITTPNKTLLGSRGTHHTIGWIEFKSDELYVFWEDAEDVHEFELTKVTDQKMSQALTPDDKKKSIFHVMWLRDNDQGPLSRHQSNRQRLFSIVDIPEDICIREAKLVFKYVPEHSSSQVVEIEFGGNNGSYVFKSIYDAKWLKEYDYCNNFSVKNIQNKQSFYGKRQLPKVETKSGYNDSLLKDLHWFTEPHIQLWDRDFFSLPSHPGIIFHDYDTLIYLNQEWKKDFFATSNEISITNPNEMLCKERRSKFKPMFDFLKDFVQYGFMLVKGVPVKEREVLNIPGLFDGFVRQTNYGPLFDVMAKKNPNNLAYTNLAVTPHTDNPYRNPVPSIQILHCLKNECEGGRSGLVDGFLAAEMIRRHSIAEGAYDSQSYFDLLSNNYIPYEYHNPSYNTQEENEGVEKEESVSKDRKPESKKLSYFFCQQCAYLCHRQPVIEINDRDQVVAVAFNNRSASAFDFPSNLSHEKSIMPEFYKAYQTFAKLIFDETMQLSFKLKPGHAMIFDNRRVLHARTGFSIKPAESSEKEEAPRHFQGCYSDKDAVFSKYLLMKKEFGE